RRTHSHALVFSLLRSTHHRHLHSFPTRRSSDLATAQISARRTQQIARQHKYPRDVQPNTHDYDSKTLEIKIKKLVTYISFTNIIIFQKRSGFFESKISSFY